MKNRRRISNIEETIVEPYDVNGKNKIFTSFSLTFFSVYLQLYNILNIFIHIYIYIYIYKLHKLSKTHRLLKAPRSKMGVIVIYMQSRKQYALPVITTMTLWQLMHLGTLYTVHIAGTNEPKNAQQAK